MNSRIDSRGYVAVYLGKKDGQSVYRYQHRLLMEAHLGRPLAENEVVHHRNGVKTDNRIENLEVMDRGAHIAFHNSSPCPPTEADPKVA